MTFTGISGSEFEAKGIRLARSLHDPLGVSGAEIYGGLERDGVFIDEREINVYEFTVATKADKAIKDGKKIASLLSDLGKKAENTYKSRTGWFVTPSDPTPAQRSEIRKIAENTGERIHAISLHTLTQRICKADEYLARRDAAPFGSIHYGGTHAPQHVDVEVKPQGYDGQEVPLKTLCERATSGESFLLQGNFGVGKSHLLRTIYRKLRKEYFRSPQLKKFPVHINLRDCSGLKTPAEILRRHAEDIGFGNPDGLVSAWRSGACVLLLDGFDEIIPPHAYVRGSDLKSFRRGALAPVRRIIQESPEDCGIVIAGRGQYFSGKEELLEATGISSHTQLSLPDFGEAELKDYLAQAGYAGNIPDWVPMRPLLLGYFVSMSSGSTGEIFSGNDRAIGWTRFIEAICTREADMLTSSSPDVIRRVLSRVATVARSESDVAGPLTEKSLTNAFVSIEGREPDEEGRQLLLRLPGLAMVDPSSSADERVFVDRDLAEAAYGLDLARYVLNVFDQTHPLSRGATWSNAASYLGVEVAANAIPSSSKELTSAAIDIRQKSDKFDAVTFDLMRAAAHLDLSLRNPDFTFPVTGVEIQEFILEDSAVFREIVFDNCIIKNLDFSAVEANSRIPRFENCIIATVDGLATLPQWAADNFHETQIDAFTEPSRTSAGIMSLSIDPESKIALTILKKIYAQTGSGRKESALSRGISADLKGRVKAVISTLVSDGWIEKSSSSGTTVYVPVKTRRAEALQALNAPNSFRLH